MLRNSVTHAPPRHFLETSDVFNTAELHTLLCEQENENNLNINITPSNGDVWLIYYTYHKHVFFFMEKNKANERSGHLMVSDYRRPRPRATPKELQVRCRPLRWR